uniref:Uncharacterized protein n=1 Tax=Bombyx mori TaxID=7091 RepID=A0A8R2QXX0_BOMMO|nr:uncharacterized protein LOC101741159 isoform X4 [Bombyx mori]
MNLNEIPRGFQNPIDKNENYRLAGTVYLTQRTTRRRSYGNKDNCETMGHFIALCLRGMEWWEYDDTQEKPRMRKATAQVNVQKVAYIQAMEMEVVTEADVTRALINIKEDKIEMKKTGGGFWKPKSTETDAKVLSIIKEQTEPLHNPYDSAADFFNDVVEITCTDEGNKLIDNDLINSSPYTPCVALKEISMTTDLEEVTPKRVASESEGKVLKKREFSMESGSIKKINEPAHIKMLQKKKVTPRKLIKKSSAEQLKNTYLKKKKVRMLIWKEKS